MSRLFAVPVGLVALALLTAVQALPSLREVRADPAALLVAYLSLRSDVPGGAVAVLLLGLLVDGVTGGPVGLHMFTLQVLFVALRLTANGLQLEPSPRVWPMAVAAAVAHQALVTTLVLGATAWEPQAWVAFLPSLGANTLLAWPVVAVADRLARRYSPEPDRIFLNP